MSQSTEKEKRSISNKRHHDKILSDPEKLQKRKEQLKQAYERRKMKEKSEYEDLLTRSTQRGKRNILLTKAKQCQEKKEKNRVYWKRRISDDPEKNKKRTTKLSQKYHMKKKNDAKAFAISNQKQSPEEMHTINTLTSSYKKTYENYKYMSLEEFLATQFDVNQMNKYKNEEQDKCKCIIKCGYDCLNVNSDMECDKFTCNVVGGGCGNVWTKLSSWAISDCVPCKQGDMGFGLKAMSQIKTGAIIGPYIGERSTNKSSRSAYTMQIGQSWVDARLKGNNTRYINQSCSSTPPNCTMVKRLILGEETGWLVASQNIEENEFLSFDYGSRFYLEHCLCNSCKEK